MLYGALGIMIYAALFTQCVRSYGWASTLLLMLSIPFMAAAWFCFIFAETAILAGPLALVGILLGIGSAVLAWNYPSARLRRLERRQILQADRRDAQAIIDENQRLRRR